jgi:hypothetical protein
VRTDTGSNLLRDEIRHLPIRAGVRSPIIQTSGASDARERPMQTASTVLAIAGLLQKAFSRQTGVNLRGTSHQLAALTPMAPRFRS